jgi:molecular chaperone DnaK
LVKTLSRSKLEQLVADLIKRTEGPCRQALADAGLSAREVDEVILVGGMTRMPAVQEKVKEIFGREPSRSVNPDEAVALGAAIQAGVLSGNLGDVVLLDVTPLTLGLETLGGVMTTLIPRNTTIPTKKTETFTTAADGQSSVEVHVLQGERPMAADNKSIGRFILDGILPAPRGVPQIDVTFDIDANGILSVSARDKGTGREQKIVVQPSSGLSKGEIDRMVNQAKSHEAEDQRRRAEIETRSLADSLTYNAEKTLREGGDKLPADLRREVEGKITQVRSALQGGDIAQVQQATNELQAALQKVGAHVYAGAGVGQGGQPSSGSSGEGPISDGTVEGEFREV